jgi:hypothetical protein
MAPRPGLTAAISRKFCTAGARGSGLDLGVQSGRVLVVDDEVTARTITETMHAAGGSTSRAAELLGISTRTVQYRMHQYHEAQRSELEVVRKRDKKD